MAAIDDARSILATLQAAVDSRDPDRLVELFDEQAVLIGTTADARDRESIRAYVTALAAQPETLRWEWDDMVPFHESPGEVGFAAFGEVVAGELRAPIRVTILAVETPDGWRLRQFHGSIPYGLPA
jgi:hypothetical protein